MTVNCYDSPKAIIYFISVLKEFNGDTGKQ